jgi:hypothetical protein
MKLFIANAKQQTESFTYRVPDGDPMRGMSVGSPRTQPIPTGQQIQVAGDLTSAQIEAVVEQHRPYGLIDVSELNGIRTYAGLVFSIDKPVPDSRIMQLMGSNIGVLEEKGREMREMAAIATNQDIESNMADQQMPGRITNLEMEVVEERNAKSTGPEMVPQRIRVTRNDDQPQKTGQRKQGGRARRGG